VPPRFVKRRGRNSLEGQVLAELDSRGLPPPAQIVICPDKSVAMRHFVRVRHRGSSPPPVDAGYALRITWNQPVDGPIVVGYASHFGLGLFVAELPDRCPIPDVPETGTSKRSSAEARNRGKIQDEKSGWARSRIPYQLDGERAYRPRAGC